MRPNPERNSERWLRQAERDLDDARFAAQGARHNLACFLAQQAAEKAVKSYLYARGAETESVIAFVKDKLGGVQRGGATAGP